MSQGLDNPNFTKMGRHFLKVATGLVRQDDEIFINYGTYGQTNKLLEYGYVEMGPLTLFESFHISAEEVFASYRQSSFCDMDVIDELEEKHPQMSSDDPKDVFFEIYANGLGSQFRLGHKTTQ